MRKWLNNWFDFSKGEFNGLLVLFGLILGFALLPLTFEWIDGDDDVGENTLALKELVWMEEVRKSATAITFHPKNSRLKFEPFEFDPNEIDVNGWQRLGLSLKQAQSVRKYVEKGGKFFNKEDVQRMYTIAPEVYVRMEPYIKIKSHPASSFTPYEKKVVKIRVVVEINTADTIALLDIRGIGPAFARRIVKYRERLGGFYKLEQLKEVYGLDSVKYEEIQGQLKLDGSALQRININEAGFEDLKNHPYLTYKQANAILQYRRQHGNYASFAELKKVLLLPAETVDKLAPYLSF